MDTAWSTRSLWLGMALLPTLPTASAAQAGILDQGELIISERGQAIGREQFEIRRGRASGARDGFTLTSTAVYPPGYPEHRLTAQIEFGPDSQPLAGRFDEQRADPRRVLFRLGDRRVTVRLVTAAGEAAREFPGAPAFVVLDDSVFGLHLFPPPLGRAARSVRATGDRGEPVETMDHGLQETLVSGTPRHLRHVSVRWADRTRHLWYDEEGRLVLVEDRDRGITAVRAERGTR